MATSAASTTMYFEQFYLGCLAHASYLLGSEGEAVVVDPQRDVDMYLQAASEHGLKIKHIFETHLHADFVSGHRELARRTGATIYIGAKANAHFPHVALEDGLEVQFGRGIITALETPGHTPESVCLLVTDLEKSRKPWAVLTGDTLFLGDVGRPDLSATHTPQTLAGLLYDSLHKKLMALPDDVVVYPAHGAGSLCGRNMRAEKSSTIGTERLTNYALQIATREEFVRQITENLPARPEYFLKDAEINREGAAGLDELPRLHSLTPEEVKTLLEKGAPALDVRPGEDFAAGHIPGSINIALSGQFATWAGTVLGLEARPILIADADEQIAEAQIRLARVGLDAGQGYLVGGVKGWESAGYPLAKTAQVNVEDLVRELRSGKIVVLDVRRDPERKTGHVDGSSWWPLDRFKAELPAMDKNLRVAVHCKSGYRSMVACSMLQRAGYENVVNVTGGFDAWEKAGAPVVRA